MADAVELPIDVTGATKAIESIEGRVKSLGKSMDETGKAVKRAFAVDALVEQAQRMAKAFDSAASAGVQAAADLTRAYLTGGPFGLAFSGAVSIVENYRETMRVLAEEAGRHVRASLEARQLHAATVAELNSQLAESERIRAAVVGGATESEARAVFHVADAIEARRAAEERLAGARSALAFGNASGITGDALKALMVGQEAAEQAEAEARKRQEVAEAQFAILMAEKRKAENEKKKAEAARHFEEVARLNLDANRKAAALAAAEFQNEVAERVDQQQFERDARRQAEEEEQQKHRENIAERARLQAEAHEQFMAQIAARTAAAEQEAEITSRAIDDANAQIDRMNDAIEGTGQAALGFVKGLVLNEGQRTKAALEGKAKEALVEAAFATAEGLFLLAVNPPGATAAFAAAAKFAAVAALAGGMAATGVGVSSGGSGGGSAPVATPAPRQSAARDSGGGKSVTIVYDARGQLSSDATIVRRVDEINRQRERYG